jgi:hypothetical protein
VHGVRVGSGQGADKSGGGEVEGIVIAVIYTLRGERRRIISARRAKRNERQAYREAVKGNAQAGSN